MACFVVPLVEGIVVTGASLALNFANKRKTSELVSESKKSSLSSLQKMLFGGSFLLAIEHIYHGEVVFYPPFLTAMNSPEDTAEMLHEMSTVGVCMAVLVTLVWAVMMFALKMKFAKIIKEKSKPILNTFSAAFFSAALMWSIDLVAAGENGILVLGSVLISALFFVLSVFVAKKEKLRV